MDYLYERFDLFTDFEGNVYGGSAHVYERTLYVYFDLVIGDVCCDIRSNDFLVEMFFKYLQSEKGVNIFKQDYNAIQFSYRYIVDEKLD